MTARDPHLPEGRDEQVARDRAGREPSSPEAHPLGDEERAHPDDRHEERGAPPRRRLHPREPARERRDRRERHEPRARHPPEEPGQLLLLDLALAGGRGHAGPRSGPRTYARARADAARVRRSPRPHRAPRRRVPSGALSKLPCSRARVTVPRVDTVVSIRARHEKVRRLWSRSTGSTSTSVAARSSRSSARTAPARRRSSGSIAGLVRATSGDGHGARPRRRARVPRDAPRGRARAAGDQLRPVLHRRGGAPHPGRLLRRPALRGAARRDPRRAGPRRRSARRTAGRSPAA